jgi:8-hydroxy-5-deazaflavin:NADPH oxidoreductase
MGVSIGVIGSGVVGRTLASGFLKSGHPVLLGSRDQNKLTDIKTELGGALQTGSVSDAVAFGEIIVFAVKGSSAEDAIKLAKPEKLAGKIVIDTTNPIADAPPVNGVLQFFTGPNDSLMERLQRAAPQARFVKAWSCVGSLFMVHPSFPDGRPTMFICGNDAAAKGSVQQLLAGFGWDCEDMGRVESARAIEPLCQLWCIPGLQSNRWSHAFKLLKM